MMMPLWTAALLQATQPGGPMQQFSDTEQAVLTTGVTGRLLLAALLGGVIGLDRELHKKACGMRTNLLICFASALFTFLSPVIAGASGGNKGQIAANIVQGIGFLGAGLILHNRMRVNGLTSAATVFAVAAVGMSCGAGLYMVALFATLVVLATLEVVGLLEGRVGIKAYTIVYEVRTRAEEEARSALLAIMDRDGRRLEVSSLEVIDGLARMSMDIRATRRTHARLLAEIQASSVVDKVLTFQSLDEDSL